MTPDEARAQAVAAVWTHVEGLVAVGDWLGAAQLLQHDHPAPELDELAVRLHRLYRRRARSAAVRRWLTSGVRRYPAPRRRGRRRPVVRQVRRARALWRFLS